MIDLHYSMLIQWSDEDRVYIVHLPEFGDGAKTHGETYDEAAKNGREVLEMLVESYMDQGDPLPKPRKYLDVAPRMKLPKQKSAGPAARNGHSQAKISKKVKAHVTTRN